MGRILNINRFSARYHLANPDHVRISSEISGFSESADEWQLLPIEAGMVILQQKLEPEPIHCSDCFWAGNLAKIGSSFLRPYFWYKAQNLRTALTAQAKKNNFHRLLNKVDTLCRTRSNEWWELSENLSFLSLTILRVSVFWRLGRSSK